MSDEDDVTWLIQEIRELLEVGRVGLYEFTWSLRSRHSDWEPAQFRSINRAVLLELLKDPTVQLVWLVWATSTDPVPANLDAVVDRVWDEIGEDPYLAIDRL